MEPIKEALEFNLNKTLHSIYCSVILIFRKIIKKHN